MSFANRCLVTGAGGFFGRYVADALEAQGWEVWKLSRSPLGERGIRADLTSCHVALPTAFARVFHIAGAAHLVPRSQHDRQRFYAVNAEGAKNLIRALERSGRLPEAVVFASSVAVYGQESGWLLDEETPRTATDPYGESKRQAEDALHQWASKRGLRLGIVRLPLVAGRKAPGNLGKMLWALRRRVYVGVGDGSARRSMVLAEDAAQAVCRVADVGGVFHVTDGRHPSFAEMEEALAAALRIRPPLRIPIGFARLLAAGSSLAGSVAGAELPFNGRMLNRMLRSLTFSDEKVSRAIGWTPRPVLQAIRELVR